MSHPDTGFNLLTPTRYGAMLVNRHDQYVGESLIKLGEYSKAEMDFLRAIVPVGGFVVEAGAHIGALTIPLAQHVGPDGFVAAFEPQYWPFLLLASNVSLANLANVRCHRRALDSDEREIVVSNYDPHEPYNSGGWRMAGARGAVSGTGVPVCRLDSDPNLGRVDLIKADVEGAELGVLRGATETIAQHRPLLYLEAYDADKRWALFAWLVEHQYQFRWHFPPMYAADNWKQAPNPWPDMEHLISLNVIAVPDERAADFWAQHGADPYLREVRL